MSERPTQAEIEQEVENIAESCGLWPRHDDIQRRFLDGADMRESLQEFATKLRAPLLAEIEQLKEEIERLTQRVKLGDSMRDARNAHLQAQLTASQEQVRCLVAYIDKAIYADSANERQAILEEALAATAPTESNIDHAARYR